MDGVSGFGHEPSLAPPAPVVESDRRRSERLLLTIPIRVEGLDPKGQKFAENTRTLVINRQGARIQLKHPVTPGARVQISTMVGNRQANFRVVGPTKPVTAEGGEWGVECLEEKGNIWGIGFPPSKSEEGLCSALLECRRCHAVILIHISLVEHDVLASSGLITRECKSCERETAWGYTEQALGMPAPGQEAEPSISEVMEPPQPTANRRVYGRVALKLPVRVRNYYGVEEFTKTENVSKGGTCFISDKNYEMGEILLVTCPFEKGGHNIEVRAKVVRCRELVGTGRKIYGVRYEK